MSFYEENIAAMKIEKIQLFYTIRSSHNAIIYIRGQINSDVLLFSQKNLNDSVWNILIHNLGNKLKTSNIADEKDLETILKNYFSKRNINIKILSCMRNRRMIGIPNAVTFGVKYRAKKIVGENFVPPPPPPPRKPKKTIRKYRVGKY